MKTTLSLHDQPRKREEASFRENASSRLKGEKKSQATAPSTHPELPHHHHDHHHRAGVRADYKEKPPLPPPAVFFFRSCQLSERTSQQHFVQELQTQEALPLFSFLLSFLFSQSSSSYLCSAIPLVAFPGRSVTPVPLVRNGWRTCWLVLPGRKGRAGGRGGRCGQFLLVLTQF